MPPLHASPDKPNRHISPFRLACPREAETSFSSVASASIQAGGEIPQTRPALSFHPPTASPSPLHVRPRLDRAGELRVHSSDALRVLSSYALRVLSSFHLL